MVRLHITFLHFTARNRCGAYNPVTPDISFWLVRTKTTELKIVTLLAKSTPDLFKLIPPSHRRRGATTVFGRNRHHRSDTASIFSWFSTTRHSCVFPRVVAEPQRCHCEHDDLIELQLRFDGGATAIIGGMTAVLAAALRDQ